MSKSNQIKKPWSNMAGKSISNMESSSASLKKGLTWMKIENWLKVSKLLVGVGLIIFLISTMAKQVDGELASFYWMAIGIVSTLIMTTILLANQSKGESLMNIIGKMFSLYVPSIVTLIPLVAMIIIFHEVRNILNKDAAHLPDKFYTFHYLSFFFIFLQIIMLNQFFSGEIKALFSKQIDPNKWAYISGFIFFSIIAMISVGELYVIITHFITDG